MTSKAGNGFLQKLESIDVELSKIEEKLLDYDDVTTRTLSYIESELPSLQKMLDDTDDFEAARKHTSHCVANIKSKLSTCIKSHRDVHLPISKFGKLVDKSFVDDLTHLTSYFAKKNWTPGVSSKSPFSPTSKESKSSDELLRLVIIEHLLREGIQSLAVELMNNFNFTQEDIRLDKFKELSALVSAIRRGQLEPAKRWLSDNRDRIGTKAKQLEYTIIKLEFLSTMQSDPVDPAAIINSARQLVPFASEYSSDFEHLMGSLVFIGRSLDDTPYADLMLPLSINTIDLPLNAETANNSNSDPTVTDDDVVMGSVSSPSSPTKSTTSAQVKQDNTINSSACNSNVLTEAADLFKSCCCYQLNLSHMDPLFTAFFAGCRMLTRLQSLQRAISCLNKYSSMDVDVLPVSVKLDLAAHRHNIFHCPVIKEVTSESNVPVRLTCGHAISRDAFNSLASGDRNRMKCPYCPVETYKNQVLELIF